MKLNLKIDATNAVNSKFLNTLKLLSGYIQEAKGDVAQETNYSPKSVYDRLNKIEAQFKADLAALAKDITVSETLDESN